MLHAAWSTGTQPPAGALGGTDADAEGDADGVELGADGVVGAADALGDVAVGGPNVNQFRFTKSDVDVLFMTAKTVCGPAGALDALAVTVVHFCQPPVWATGKLASSVPVCVPRRSSTAPPSVLCAATRAVSSAPVIETPSYRSQSPLASQPTFLPPSASPVLSVCAPDCAAKASAWTRPCTATSSAWAPAR